MAPTTSGISEFFVIGHLSFVRKHSVVVVSFRRILRRISYSDRAETSGDLGSQLGKSDVDMVFTKRLREGIRRGRIRCSVRVWTRLHVKVGGRYPMDDGHIVVDSIKPISLDDVTSDLARESGFQSVEDLLQIARHGKGENIYLIRFHYLAPGAWDTPRPRK